MILSLEQGQDNIILTTPSSMVDFENPPFDLETFATDLKETMKHAKGVGIAAPQVGKGYAMCIVSDAKDQEMVMINPHISFFSKDTAVDEEGCLSLPDITVKVERSKKIRVTYFDLAGKKHTIKAKGFFARVIQHEVDHLNGILITDK